MNTRCTNHGTRTSFSRGRGPARADRGAILVQTAIMMVGLTAFSAFIVDYGILWTARRQIQNAADAAALAAAVSLGFDAPGDQARARQNALTAVAQNPVWGAAAAIGNSDITFPACPAGSVGGGGGCVRVQAFRNQGAGNPLSTIFARLVNVADQGVQATATAQVLYGASSDCVKPFAIPDRWDEYRNNVGPIGWDPLDTFERYVLGGGGVLLPGAVDAYTAPGGPGANGSGFSRGSTPFTPGDYGVPLAFTAGDTPRNIRKAGNEEFVPVRISAGSASPADFLTDIATCSPRVVVPGDDIEVEPGPVYTETDSGVASLIDQDAAATWNPAMNGGLGGVSGGCMASGSCTVSPRIVAVPVFNPDAWDLARPAANSVIVSRVVGFFIERVDLGKIYGRLMVYPAAPRSSMTADPQSAFVVGVALVR